MHLRGLTFELSGRQRQDAKPGLAKMYRVPPDRAWWPAVGAPLERGVRRQSRRHSAEKIGLAVLISRQAPVRQRASASTATNDCR